MLRHDDQWLDDRCDAHGDCVAPADHTPERAKSHTCPTCGYVNWCVYSQGHSGLCLCDQGHAWEGIH